MCKDISNEVDTELKNHPGIGAVVNTETGQVQLFAAPRPYWEAENATGDTALTAEEVTALERELAKLSDSLPTQRRGERAKTEHRIRVIERALKANRSLEEDALRAAERAAERPAQRYGTQGATVQSVVASVASAVAAVNAVVGSTPAPSRSNSTKLVNVRPWPDQLRPQAGPPSTAVSAKVCCSGPREYWCGRCRAK